MSPTSLSTALCLAAPDVEFLAQGETIAAIARTTLHQGQTFALYPYGEPAKNIYHENLRSIAQAVINQSNSQIVCIRYWADLFCCLPIDRSCDLALFSKFTVWTQETLETLIEERYRIFVVLLRVYLLPQPIELSKQIINSNSIGSFIKLPQSISVEYKNPVTEDPVFQKSQSQLLNQELPVTQLEPIVQPKPEVVSPLAWIQTITKLADRSIEEDTGKKGNYEAGTDFENIVRKSLEFLGFSIAQEYKGGAGGLDFYCAKPYSVIGECKAGKKIPSDTTEQLVKLGGMHLTPELFLPATKLIIGPGTPSQDVIKAAQQWNVSIMNAKILQRLVEIQAQYPNCINLIELKDYFKVGLIEEEIDKLISIIKSRLRLRSFIVETVRKHLTVLASETTDIGSLYTAFLYSDPPESLSLKEMQEILVELSSPLTGYLGRKKGEDGNDRFYYLRDLPLHS
jgi:hypothetical protein